MTISLLRAFIQHSSSTKPLIMSDKPYYNRNNKSIIQTMLWLVNPINLDKIDKETENAILALLT